MRRLRPLLGEQSEVSNVAEWARKPPVRGRNVYAYANGGMPAERLHDYSRQRHHRAWHHRHRKPLRRLRHAYRFALPGHLLRPDLLFGWYLIKWQPAIYGC